MIEFQRIAELRRQGIKASPMFVLRNPSIAEAREWLERHRYDDDPPKALMSYVEWLLDQIERNTHDAT